MPNSQKAFLTQLTAGEMKKLLVARERIDVLLAEKEKLTKALNRIDDELSKLMDGAGATKTKSPGKKKSGPKKKVTRKKAVKKKVAPKKALKVSGKKSVKKTIKKVTKKTTKKTSRRAPAKTSGRDKLEDVVVKVIKANGGPMSYKELISVIVKKKLFVSKSSNFDNVLRRTLSTSKLVKRAGRGIYKVA